MNDELALMDALHDLTSDQPDAPADRVTAVRRRHVRRRGGQSAIAAVAAAVAVVGVLFAAGVVAGGTSQPKSLQQPTPKSWQLPWPDRSATQPIAATQANAVKAQALAYLARRVSGPLGDVHWLFAGALEIKTRWAVFEASSGPGHIHQLIAMSSRNSGRSWAVSSDQAPPPTTGQIGFVQPDGKWLLVLAAPGVDQVGLSDLSSGEPRMLPGVDTSDGVVVDHLERAAAPEALLVGSPDLASTFVVRFPDGGHVLPTWERELLSHAPPIAGYRKLSGEAGGTPSTDGATVTNHGGYAGPMIEVIRCAGQAPLTFSMTTEGHTSSRQIERCDGQSVTVHLGKLGADGKYVYTISGDPTAVYAMAVYVQRPK